MQRDEPFKGFPNIFFPTETTWWLEHQTGQHLRPPPPRLQCRAGTKAHTKASKVARGSGHIRGHLIFACVWGQEGGREDGNTDFHSICFLYKHNVNRLQKASSAIWEVMNTSDGPSCWQIVPPLNEMSLFIIICPIDYMKQRWAKSFKQVFPDPIFYITGKQRQTSWIIWGQKELFLT